MIKIERPPVSDFLLSEKVKMEKDSLRAAVENNSRIERLRFNDDLLYTLRSELYTCFNNKCAYCETRIDPKEAVIDNYRPRAGTKGLNNEFYPLHYWWLAYEWDNLFLACEVCSRKYKRDYFPLEDESARAQPDSSEQDIKKELPLIVNPCIDDPEEHLFFEENGFATAKTQRGSATLDILGLNRGDLVEARKSRVSHMLELLASVSHKDNQETSVTYVYNYVNDLHSGHSTEEFIAPQLAAFLNWYEKNKDLWESIESRHTGSRISKKSMIQEISAATETLIQKVKEKISILKRFSVKSIDIENFKSIENIHLDILPVSGNVSREPWLLMLGDNGAGKSSILQAITLALSTPEQLAKLSCDPDDYIRHGKDKSIVTIRSFEQDEPVVLTITKSGFSSNIKQAPAFVLSYGSTRLMPKGKIQPDMDKEPYYNVSNMFDYSVALEDPRKWLKELPENEWTSRVRPALFDLLDLRAGDELTIKENDLCIHQYGDDHELEGNSDGYKSIVALSCDMMQTLSIDNSEFDNTYGIVLLDELGNHLHPRWRMKIVSSLRKAFPKIQFIVTSHEPLCLRGLGWGEVVVLARDSNNRIRSLDKSVLPDHSLLRIDQLLTSDLFGLINVLDDATEKMYADYYALLAIPENKRTEEEKAKIKRFSENLVNKELLGGSAATQAVFELMNQSYVDLKKDGFKTVTELKEETKTEVRKLIGEKKIDWL